MGNAEKLGIAKIILKKNKVKGRTELDFEFYYENNNHNNVILIMKIACRSREHTREF